MKDYWKSCMKLMDVKNQVANDKNGNNRLKSQDLVRRCITGIQLLEQKPQREQSQKEKNLNTEKAMSDKTVVNFIQVKPKALPPREERLQVHLLSPHYCNIVIYVLAGTIGESNRKDLTTKRSQIIIIIRNYNLVYWRPKIFYQETHRTDTLSKVAGYKINTQTSTFLYISK